jgi:hypothetical protein
MQNIIVAQLAAGVIMACLGNNVNDMWGLAGISLANPSVFVFLTSILRLNLTFL